MALILVLAVLPGTAVLLEAPWKWIVIGLWLAAGVVVIGYAVRRMRRERRQKRDLA